MDIILIAGLWLPVSVWDRVADELTTLGHRPVPVPLPGVDDGASAATLEDQLAAVLAAVDGADRPLVVGHSAAATLAWLVADQRPDSITGTVMIGGFPAAADTTYADFFPAVDGSMAFPGWEPFEGPDSDDLDAAARSGLEAIVVAVPEGVSKGIVRYGGDRRFDRPVLLVCPEFDPQQAQEWIDGGDIPELAKATHLSFADIDSGHWPMVTKPTELAAILAAAAVERGDQPA